MTDPKIAAFLHSPAGQHRLQSIVTTALAVGHAAQANPGACSVTVAGKTDDTQPGGMCCKQARQIHEIAFGLHDHSWQFAAATAHDTEQALIAAGRQLSGIVAGCVLCFNDGSVGHIVTYAGNNECVENTSDGSRGVPQRPGTKITPLSEIAAAHGGNTGRPYYAGLLV